MSQQEWTGDNWPEGPVAAVDPLGGGPARVTSADSDFPRGWANRSSTNSGDELSERQSRAFGVAHVVIIAASVSVVPLCRPDSVEYPAEPDDFASPAVVVGHPDRPEEDPVSSVRRPDARSRQSRRPDGVAHSFQVSLNSGEPVPSKFAFNLLSKESWRATLTDEAEELGPQVALVGGSGALAAVGEGLAGARTSPDRLVVGPSGEAEGEGPSSDAGEEVGLRVKSNIVCLDFFNGPPVHGTVGDAPGGGEVLQPSGGEGVELVVVRAHAGSIPRRLSLVNRSTNDGVQASILDALHLVA